MFEHELAGAGAAPGDDVEHPLGQHVCNKPRQLQHGKRSMVGRLEHGAAPGGKHGGQLPGSHEEGEVPRHNLAHNAYGFAEHQRHGVFVQHDGSAFISAHHPGKVAEVVGGKGNVHIHGFPYGLAIVQRFHHGEVFFVGINDVCNFQQHIGPFNGVDLFPAAPGLVGSRHCCVHVFLGGFGAGCQAFAIGGAERFKRAAVRGLLPLAVDE